MKPIGPIPPGFAASGGKLAVGGVGLDALLAAAGDTPLFVYDLAMVEARVARLRAALPEGVAIHYAVKANPFAPLLASLVPRRRPGSSQGDDLASRREAVAASSTGSRPAPGDGGVDGFDVASAGELGMALAAGMAAEAISFAGPGKRDDELAEAVGAGVTINLESEGEAERAFAIAGRLGKRARLAVRVNPDFELKGSGMRMGGGAKPFGIDAERAPALVRRLIDGGADYRGLHIFAGSQSLDGAAIAEAQARTIALAARIANETGVAPPLLNLGGGFGIPYFAGDEALDVATIGRRLGEALTATPLPGTALAIELGRWLVGEAGVYLTRIVDRKVSHGKTFLITDGGMQHQLGASGNLGMVVRRNYPIAIATRFVHDAEEEVSITGCLCTPLDRLADDVMLPRADVGDIVAVFLAGAYGLTASPLTFLGHRAPTELMVTATRLVVNGGNPPHS